MGLRAPYFLIPETKTKVKNLFLGLLAFAMSNTVTFARKAPPPAEDLEPSSINKMNRCCRLTVII